MTDAEGVAVVSLCSTPRLAHLRNQLASLAGRGVRRTVVWVGDDAPPELDAECVLRVAPGRDGLRLAAGRNAGADAGVADGAELVVFLDADCVAGDALLTRYHDAARRRPDTVLCGPVTYLPPGVDVSDPARLDPAPHAARPDPPDGVVLDAADDEYRLFWSLSFAVAADAWRHRMPRFDEGYEGYGGEDTDFAMSLRARGVPMAWVGGAHAFHQHHPTQSPPWQHLDDILRNGARYAARWGEWPMTGWLDAFAAAGAITPDGAGGWRRTPLA